MANYDPTSPMSRTAQAAFPASGVKAHPPVPREGTLVLGEVKVVQAPDEDADMSYLEAAPGDTVHDTAGKTTRRQMYERGAFSMVGIYATAEYTVNSTIQEVRTPGLWGIEDDSGAAYLNEVANEQLDELTSLLKALGFAEAAISWAVGEARP
jgi:outer membrane protein assembly factor BamA